VAKEWMRERALEMDSHHECIGSSSVAVRLEMVLRLGLGFGLAAAVEAEEAEDVGELVLRFRWNSMLNLANFGLTWKCGWIWKRGD
jgi:hypothetical protein